MSRLLITGASGLLGANLSIIACRCYEVTAVCHTHVITTEDFRVEQADLADEEMALHVVNRTRPDWVIHCAAATDVDKCEESPKFAEHLNIHLTGNLAKAARQAGAGFVCISTDSVFDGMRGDYAETDVPNPVNTYAETKLDAERIVVDTVARSIIIRTNFYGWNAFDRQSLAEWMLSHLEVGRPFSGFADVYFTPILANDLAELILVMIERELMGFYNVAGSQKCSKYEFARAIAQLFKMDSTIIEPVSIKNVRLKAARPLDTSLQVLKVRKALGREMPDVVSGLQRFKALRDGGFLMRLKALGGRSASHSNCTGD